MRSSTVKRVIKSILIAQAVGVVGQAVTRPALKRWYPSLRKPSFTPSDKVFGGVWSVLFTLMGVAAYIIWSRGDEMPDLKPDADRALKIFGIQLGLNTLWSILFFGYRSPVYGLVEIGFLWAAIAATIVAFFPVSIVAAILLIPYLAWVGFAAVLNYYIWRLNR